MIKYAVLFLIFVSSAFSSKCGGKFDVATVPAINSPGFNSGFQHSNTHCNWQIYSTETDILPSVQMMTCEVDGSTQIVVHDGPTDEYPIVRTYIGKCPNTNEIIKGSRPEMYIVYRTGTLSSTIQTRGFTMTAWPNHVADEQPASATVAPETSVTGVIIVTVIASIVQLILMCICTGACVYGIYTCTRKYRRKQNAVVPKVDTPTSTTTNVPADDEKNLKPQPEPHYQHPVPSAPTSFFHENSHPTVINYTLKSATPSISSSVASSSPPPPVAPPRRNRPTAPEPESEVMEDEQPMAVEKLYPNVPDLDI